MASPKEIYSTENKEMDESYQSLETKQSALPEYYHIGKGLSKFNGTINKMSRENLIKKLKDLGLNTNGCIDVLRKRLKVYNKRNVLGNNNHCKYQYLCVIDFEATCEEDDNAFVNEIIEFPAIIIDVKNMEIVDEFHHYVKPVLNPILTDFCKKLTGISQDQVDKANLFPSVLKEFEAWSVKYRSKDKKRGHQFAVVTDGPWDIKRFLNLQCQLSGIKVPDYVIQWINIRKVFLAFYHPKGKLSLLAMCEILGYEFEGKQHCGIHDTRNITRIVITLLQDGGDIKMNEKLEVSKSTNTE